MFSKMCISQQNLKPLNFENFLKKMITAKKKILQNFKDFINIFLRNSFFLTNRKPFNNGFQK